MFISIFLLFAIPSVEYNPSLYAPSTNDYIIALHADSFYYLSSVPKPTKAKPISEAPFSQHISEEEYAWPGHPRDPANQEKENQEGQDMYNYYLNKDSLTQDDMYYHPKAPEQTWSTWDDIDTLERTKVKVTLDPIHLSYRTTNLYMPPGELITFEVLPDAVGKVTVYLEPHRQIVDISERLKYLQCQTKITRTKTTWGYPTGGTIAFEYSDMSPGCSIEINVTGCALAPHFIYGVTDEKEWEETIRSRKAPSAQITNGVINQFLPANVVRDYDRMNDGQAWLRSAALRSQQIAPDNIYGNDRYYMTSPMFWRYDNFVYCGSACAIVGTNTVDFDPSWAGSSNKIILMKDGNPWGNIHELNHHHQAGWAFNDMDEALAEATNNVLNAYTYTFQNSAIGNREVTEDLEPIVMVDHLETALPYSMAKTYYIEAEWAMIFHCFGHDAFVKYLNLTFDNTRRWEDYTGYGKHILLMMDVTGYDCFEFCKYFCDHSDRRSPQELMGDKWDKFWADYTAHTAYKKYYHPMGCFYACGFIRDGKRIETVRPFKIYPFEPTTFDFNKALSYQKTDNPEVWGDIEFEKIVSNRQEAWKELSKGIYQYQPLDDLDAIDEALAYYYDKSNKEEIICIVKLELLPLKRAHKVSYYSFTEDVCKRSFQIEECYTNFSSHTLYKETVTTYKGIPWIQGKNLTAVTNLEFIPTETDDYYFGATMSERGLLYLSDQPLKGNIVDDQDKLILVKHWYHGVNDGDQGPHSEAIHLEAGKTYYMRLVVNNADDPGVCTPWETLCRSDIGETPFVRKVSGFDGFTGDNSDVLPDDWFKIGEYHDYVPSLIDFIDGDKYKGDQFIYNNPKKWTANVSMAIKNVYNLTNTDYDYSQGKQCMDCDDANVSSTLVDLDPTTDVRSGWWPADQRQTFPHKYDVNFHGNETFSSVYLKGAYHQGYFPMDSDILIYLNTDETSEDIETQDHLIFQGVYKSKDDLPIQLPKEYTGKYLRIVINNNRLSWKDNNVGMSSFSFISVGTYLHLSKYKTPRDCNWEVRDDGYYINGKGFVGKQGDTFSYIPDKGINQIALLGDRFQGMGSANIYVGNRLVKTITSDDIDIVDEKALKYSSRSYRRILFGTSVLENQEFLIEVTKGEFRITGFIVGIAEQPIPPPQPDLPKPTSLPTAPPVDPDLPVEPTPVPPDTGPSVDNSTIHSSSDVIIFTDSGFKDETNEVDLTSIDKDIILIKGTSTTITLGIESTNAPTQDKYVSIQNPNTVVTIDAKDDYGKGEMGLDPNSQSPTVRLPSSTIPLNIYSNADNIISFQSTETKELQETVTFNRIISTLGNLKFVFPTQTQAMEAKEITLYSLNTLQTDSGNGVINTITSTLNLRDGSMSTISHLTVKEKIEASIAAQLTVNHKAVFNSESSITMSASAFIELGSSDVEGVVKELRLATESKSTLLESSNEVTLVCGQKFDCDSWLDKFVGNDNYPQAKCSTINNEKCLVAYKFVNESPAPKSNLLIIIIAVVCAVVVLIAVIIIIVYLKKRKTKNAPSSSNDLETERLGEQGTNNYNWEI